MNVGYRNIILKRLLVLEIRQGTIESVVGDTISLENSLYLFILFSLQVNDIGEPKSSKIMCGRIPEGRTWLSKTNQIQVHFHTNRNQNYNGFKLQFRGIVAKENGNLYLTIYKLYRPNKCNIDSIYNVLSLCTYSDIVTL